MRRSPLPLFRRRLCSLPGDRKSTRLNSSHTVISYAVFCLKKKKANDTLAPPCVQVPLKLLMWPDTWTFIGEHEVAATLKYAAGELRMDSVLSIIVTCYIST